MRVIVSSLVGASLLAAFAAVGSGLISGVYEQTKEPIAAAERAAEAKQLLEIFPRESHDNELIDDGFVVDAEDSLLAFCLLYTSPSPRDGDESRMPSSA